MLDPIVKTIEVPCSQEMAFRVFVREIGSWWPLGKFSVSTHAGKRPKSLHVNLERGGKIIEVDDSGNEHLWGTVKSYDPFGYFSMDFHMNEGPEAASLVEVRFILMSQEHTKVELTHSNWEAFRDKAIWMRSGYELGWGIIFEQEFKAACSPAPK